MTDLPFDIVELVTVPPPPEEAGPIAEMAYRKDAWTNHEKSVLVTMFQADAAIEEIAAALGRKYQAVRAKVDALGLRRNTSRPWSEDDDQYLIEHYRRYAVSSIAARLGRGVPGCYARAKFLKVSGAGAVDWTAWEDAQLRTGYAQGVPVAQLAVLIGRPLFGTMSRACDLGLAHVNAFDRWSPDEEKRALELAETGMRYLEIIEKLVEEGFPRRSKAGFGTHLRQVIGYGRGWGRPWTPEEDDLLRQAYAEGKSLAGEVCGQLGRTIHMVRHRTGYLGLQGTHPRPNGFRQGPNWTEEEDAYLKANYATMRAAGIAAHLGRKKGGVYNRAWQLGLDSGWCRDWTEDEDRALAIAFHSDAITMTDLAEIFDRDTAVVSKHAIKLGFNFKDRPHKPPRSPRCERHKWTLPEILALDAKPPRQTCARKRCVFAPQRCGGACPYF